MKNYTLYNLLFFIFSALLPISTLLVATESTDDSNKEGQHTATIAEDPTTHLPFFKQFMKKDDFDIDTSGNQYLNINNRKLAKKKILKDIKDIGKISISGTFNKRYKTINSNYKDQYEYPLQIKVTNKKNKQSHTIYLPHSNGDNRLLITKNKNDIFHLKMDDFSIPLITILENITPKKKQQPSERFSYYSVSIDDYLYEPSLFTIWDWGFSKVSSVMLRDTLLEEQFAKKGLKGRAAEMAKEQYKNIGNGINRKIRNKTPTMARIAEGDNEKYDTLLQATIESSKLKAQDIEMVMEVSYSYSQGFFFPEKKGIEDVVFFRNTIEKNQYHGIIIGMHVGANMYNPYKDTEEKLETLTIYFDILYILKHFDYFSRKNLLQEDIDNKSKGKLWVDIHDTRYYITDEKFHQYIDHLQKKKGYDTIHYVTYQKHKNQSLITSNKSKEKNNNTSSNNTQKNNESTDGSEQQNKPQKKTTEDNNSNTQQPSVDKDNQERKKGKEDQKNKEKEESNTQAIVTSENNNLPPKVEGSNKNQFLIGGNGTGLNTIYEGVVSEPISNDPVLDSLYLKNDNNLEKGIVPKESKPTDIQLKKKKKTESSRKEISGTNKKKHLKDVKKSTKSKKKAEKKSLPTIQKKEKKAAKKSTVDKGPITSKKKQKSETREKNNQKKSNITDKEPITEAEVNSGEERNSFHPQKEESIESQPTIQPKKTQDLTKEKKQPLTQAIESSSTKTKSTTNPEYPTDAPTSIADTPKLENENEEKNSIGSTIAAIGILGAGLAATGAYYAFKGKSKEKEEEA